jgi:hypothetical protein
VGVSASGNGALPVLKTILSTDSTGAKQILLEDLPFIKLYKNGWRYSTQFLLPMFH